MLGELPTANTCGESKTFRNVRTAHLLTQNHKKNVKHIPSLSMLCYTDTHSQCRNIPIFKFNAVHKHFHRSQKKNNFIHEEIHIHESWIEIYVLQETHAMSEPNINYSKNAENLLSVGFIIYYAYGVRRAPINLIANVSASMCPYFNGNKPTTTCAYVSYAMVRFALRYYNRRCHNRGQNRQSTFTSPFNIISIN